MAWVHVRHRVADYNRWKEVYDMMGPVKARYGWRRYRLFSVGGDRNDVLAMDEFSTAEQAQSFLQSEDFKQFVKQAGVTGAPEVTLLQGVEEGSA